MTPTFHWTTVQSSARSQFGCWTEARLAWPSVTAHSAAPLSQDRSGKTGSTRSKNSVSIPRVLRFRPRCAAIPGGGEERDERSAFRGFRVTLDNQVDPGALGDDLRGTSLCCRTPRCRPNATERPWCAGGSDWPRSKHFAQLHRGRSRKHEVFNQWHPGGTGISDYKQLFDYGTDFDFGF